MKKYIDDKKLPSLFSQKVWEAASSVPLGKVTTYGHIARAAGGGAQAARSITSILSKAPDISKIPFHRIVYADGRVWLPSKFEKWEAKLSVRLNLYKKEGIEIDKNSRIKNFQDKLHTFN